MVESYNFSKNKNSLMLCLVGFLLVEESKHGKKNHKNNN